MKRHAALLVVVLVTALADGGLASSWLRRSLPTLPTVPSVDISALFFDSTSVVVTFPAATVRVSMTTTADEHGHLMDA